LRRRLSQFRRRDTKEGLSGNTGREVSTVKSAVTDITGVKGLNLGLSDLWLKFAVGVAERIIL
jgi:hypothetical protein